MEAAGFWSEKQILSYIFSLCFVYLTFRLGIFPVSFCSPFGSHGFQNYYFSVQSLCVSVLYVRSLNVLQRAVRLFSFCSFILYVKTTFFIVWTEFLISYQFWWWQKSVLGSAMLLVLKAFSSSLCFINLCWVNAYFSITQICTYTSEPQRATYYILPNSIINFSFQAYSRKFYKCRL